MQCEIIRKHSPGRWVTITSWAFVSDFDHFKVGDNLDLASWDSYPIGFVEKFPFTRTSAIAGRKPRIPISRPITTISTAPSARVASG